jgi:hypothetical protein
VEVVGEDPEADPALCASKAAHTGAAEAKAPLELADARFDADPPVPHTSEWTAVLVLLPCLADRPAALEPDPLDAEVGQLPVVT